MRDVLKERLKELINMYREHETTREALMKGVKEFFNLRFGEPKYTVYCHTGVYESEAYEYVLVFNGERFYMDLYNEALNDYKYIDATSRLTPEDAMQIFKRLPDYLDEMIVDLKAKKEEYDCAIEVLQTMLNAAKMSED